MRDAWRWFNHAKFGFFIHWGAYACVGRGEQALFRDHLDQEEYARTACAWNPSSFDARRWAEIAKRSGARYAVLSTRHHDGFCLWDSAYTDYSTAKQAAGRDFVREYVEAFRAAGLRVGLYYSLADWRIPAYWDSNADPQGWETFSQYVHNQVHELLSNYGKIDVIWFDGAWPHTQGEWQSHELVEMIRSLQPDILINNRLGVPDEGPEQIAGDTMGVGQSLALGDFGTPEHQIIADPERLWESCQVSTWRLWGYTTGEHWRSSELLLDFLVESASMGGNLLLNVGPTPEGEFPQPFVERAEAIGRWLEVHGECIYDASEGDLCEFITYGRQILKGNTLYLVIRFWDGSGQVRLAGITTPLLKAELLTTGQTVPFVQEDESIIISGLPLERPCELFPVIKLTFAERPQTAAWAKDRLWQGDPRRMTDWAAARGTSVWADGRPREE